MFTEAMAGQATFFSDHLTYSDEAIRAACGHGIDDLFPLRIQNAATLAQYTETLRTGENPRLIWEHARGLAGYIA